MANTHVITTGRRTDAVHPRPLAKPWHVQLDPSARLLIPPPNFPLKALETVLGNEASHPLAATRFQVCKSQVSPGSDGYAAKLLEGRRINGGT